MARPIKKGLDYFPLDVDIFQDGKVRRLRSIHGNDGIIAYIYLLCSAYASEGYYLNVDDNFIELMADDLKMSVNNIGLIMNYLLSRSLFDNTLFQSVKVLSSTGIQLRYQEAIKTRALKNPVFVNKKFWLLSDDETQSYIKFKLNDSYSEKNNSKSEKNNSKSEEKPPKGKESKGKETKEDIGDKRPRTLFVKPTLEEVKAYCLERGNKIDPEYYIDFNESNGWVQGKNRKPIKDWKAQIRTWEKLERDKKQNEVTNPFAKKVLEIDKE